LPLQKSLACGPSLKSCQANIITAKDCVRRHVLRPEQDVRPSDLRVQNNPLIVLIEMVTQPGFNLVGPAYGSQTPVNFPARM
jgi:hypothetical protein